MAAELEQLRVSLVAELVGREAFEQLKREVNQVKAATEGLDTTQQNLRRTVTESEKAVRQQRQAFSQAGMQINQFAGQVAGGTPVMTAFVQQVGDIAYVVGQAGGALGRFGAFLSGPWGAAILVGISVLGPLIQKLWESKKAAEEAKSAFSMYIASLSATSKLSDVFTENGRKIAETKGKVAQLTAELTKLQTTSVEFKGEAAYAAATASRDARIKTITKELAIGKALIQQKEGEIQAATQLARLQEARLATEAKIKQGHADDRKAASQAERDILKAQKAAQKLAETRKQIQEEIKIFTIKDTEDFSKAMQKLGDESSKAIDRTAVDTLQSTMSVMSDQFETMKKGIDEAVYYGSDAIKSLSDTMGRTFSDGINGMITGAMTFKSVMSSVIDAVITKLFEMFVVQQITGFISGALSSAFNVTMPISGKKAIGGPVQSGSAYMVGENGPEMFVPSRSGSIIPNNALGGGMTINVDARGSADPGAVRTQVELGIAQAAPYIIAAAQNRTLKTAGRTRLPGTIG